MNPPRDRLRFLRLAADRPGDLGRFRAAGRRPVSSGASRLIALKYLTRINRWTTLDGAPVALLQEATGGDLSLSLLWHDLLCGYGVSDVASLVFRDGFGCWGFLDLWRRTIGAIRRRRGGLAG